MNKLEMGLYEGGHVRLRVYKGTKGSRERFAPIFVMNTHTGVCREMMGIAIIDMLEVLGCSLVEAEVLA